MLKTLIGWLSIFLCFTVGASRAFSEELRVGLYQNPPKIFSSPEGKAQGFWPAFTEAVINELGHTYRYVDCEWAQCLELLERGEIDIMPDVAFSEERATRFKFSRHPVLYAWSALVIPEGGNIDNESQLNSLRIAVVEGSIQSVTLHDKVKSGDLNVHILDVADMDAAAAKVSAGEADAAITNWYFASNLPESSDLSIATLPFRVSYLHFAFPPETPDQLIRQVDLAIYNLQTHENSAFHHAGARWLSEGASTALPGWLVPIILVGLAILAILSLLVLAMRRIIRSRTRELQNTVTKLDSEIKQRKLAEEAAFESQKQEAIGKMTGGVAHDFNNLLAVIMGSMELLRNRVTDKDAIGLIDDSIGAAERGASLTRNMLAFARRAQLETGRFQLNDLIQKLEGWTSRTLPSNIEIVLDLSAELWTTEADASSTESAILNLILNARDAMPKGGMLTIRTRNVTMMPDDPIIQQFQADSGRYVTLSIIDTGEGIAKENIARVFDPFFTTKPAATNSGLGLSMVHGFMNQSGGFVGIESEAGVGTHVNLYFRAKKALPESASANENAPQKNIKEKSARILVVEDEPAVLKVLVSSLSSVGYATESKTSGDEALLFFSEDSNFDLLLTDIIMPGQVQGFELARLLRETRPNLPVIFLTGYANGHIEEDQISTTKDVCLMKPIMSHKLIAAIEHALTEQG